MAWVNYGKRTLLEAVPNMAKVLILVEGQTEEAFVKNLLATYLRNRNVFVVPVIVATKRLLTGDKMRGGFVPYSRLRTEVLRLLNDSSAVCVTTMLDYYGLAPEFPGREKPIGKTAVEKVDSVEQAWADDINSQRFVPYLALHEFEAMLFAEPAEIANSFGFPALRASLQNIRASFPTPEDINDHEETAPSKRLGKLFPGYNKPFYGELISERIGIERIRNECGHFATWLKILETFGMPCVTTGP
jgi:hypothetical protein